MTFEAGTKLIHTESGIAGVVVPNFKLPGDICVKWENGLEASYDADFLESIVQLDPPILEA